MASSSKKNVTSMPQESSSDEDDNESSSQNEFLPGYKTLQEYTQAGFRALWEMTKTSNNLPDEEHWPYFSSFPSFQDAMSSQGNQVVKLMSNVLKSQGVRGNMTRRDMEEKFDLLLDANDTLLERVAMNLDEVAGIRKNPEPAEDDSRRTSKPLSGSWNQSPSTTIANSPQVSRLPSAAIMQHARLLGSKVIARPQLDFPDKIDNSFKPFEPCIKEKPNAKKPLSLLLEVTENGEGFSHPYGYELDMFEPSAEQLAEVTPRPARPLADTPLKYVDTEEGLTLMIDDLRNYHELALDLEHHSYRSFQGFTCLMQISTRHCDYVVDPLKLRGSLHRLNELFTKPSVVKVLHGADSDVEWLQRDLGLYLVNMFDTHQAGKLLNLPRLSLAFLVKYYCNIELDKTFQLADWRLRPLLPEMIEYARSDTHYLLYVYDRIRSDLWETGLGTDRLMRAAVQQSTQICKKIYIKPQFSEESHLKMYQKTKKMFNNRQMWALKELYSWRDQTARKEDESLGYVLPNHMLLQIAEALPREMQGILACCNPIPPLMRQNLGLLHRIVLRAREQPLVQVAASEEGVQRAPQTAWTKVNIESSLHCPHQLPPREEQRDDLPTLLGPQSTPQVAPAPALISLKPRINLLGASNGLGEMMSKVLSPYQRYLLVKPYMQHLASQAELQAADKKAPQPSPDDSNQQRMEKIKQHFMTLDTRTAANTAPTPRSESPEAPEATQVKNEPVSEGEEEGPPVKKTKQDPEVALAPPPLSKRKQKQEKWRRRQLEMQQAEQAQPSQQPQKQKQQQKQGKEQKKKYIQNHDKKKKARLDPETGVTAILTRHDAAESGEAAPEAMASLEEEEPQPEAFDYSQVDFSRFQGGSKQAKARYQKGKDRGGGGGKFGRGKGRKFNFPQRQNQKSLTYKN